jgi:hypothetical protein
VRGKVGVGFRIEGIGHSSRVLNSAITPSTEV